MEVEIRRFGYRRLTILLRRENRDVNHKRVYRLYQSEGLGVRRRKRKRIGAAERQPLTTPTRPNERWSMDFVADALNNARRFRSLNIVDDYNRRCLAAEVDTSLAGGRGSSGGAALPPEPPRREEQSPNLPLELTL